MSAQVQPAPVGPSRPGPAGSARPDASVLVDRDGVAVTHHVVPVGRREVGQQDAGVDVDVLTLYGEFDMYTTRHLRRVVLDGALLDRRHLVLNLNAVTFMDSTTVGLLVLARRLAVRQRCAFALVAQHDPVRKLLEIVGLHRVLHLHASVEEAVRAVATHRPAGS